jgi:radical SAM-linked protein
MSACSSPARSGGASGRGRDLNRYRITFTRDKTIRFVGHLDLAKTWERILRRADLPVAYSQGFHPLPKITFASALPVGCTSEAELMDIILAAPCEPASVMARLSPALPAGIAITSVVEVPLQAPALQASLRWAEYVVTVETDETQAQVESKVSAFMSVLTFPRERRGKTYDLRTLVLSLSIETVRPPSVQLGMRLLADANAGTGRPDEVLAAMGWSDAPVRIHRRKLGFEN